MDVDHFDPTLRGQRRNAYSNLMLATHHCNMMKSATWTKPVAASAGSVRLINPCEEADYGVHLFEDPGTHEVVGWTARGRLQIDTMDLNHPAYVRERKERSDYYLAKRSLPAYIKGSYEDLMTALSLADATYSRCIPEIPEPPRGDAPE